MPTLTIWDFEVAIVHNCTINKILFSLQNHTLDNVLMKYEYTVFIPYNPNDFFKK